MVQERRPTADRFVGGAESRVENVVKLLGFVESENPERDELFEWLSSTTDLGTEGTFDKHIGFLLQINLLDENGEFRLGPYGQEALVARDSDECRVEDVVYTALTSTVKGFDHLLDELESNSISIDERAEVLSKAYKDRDFSDAVAQKHYVWLESIGYIEKKSGHYKLTTHGNTPREEPRNIENRTPSSLRKRPETQIESSEKSQDEEITYLADLEALNRKKESHEEALDLLEEKLKEKGYDCYETDHSDLLAISRDTVLLVEAKTIHPSTAFEQIRLALGQLFEYEYYDVLKRKEWESKEPVKCLFLHDTPGEELANYLRHLQNQGIEVLWLDSEEIRGPSESLI